MRVVCNQTEPAGAATEDLGSRDLAEEGSKAHHHFCLTSSSWRHTRCGRRTGQSHAGAGVGVRPRGRAGD